MKHLITILSALIFVFYFNNCDPLSVENNGDGSTQNAVQVVSANQIRGFAPQVQDQYDYIIIEAFKTLTKSQLSFLEYKAVIGVESSFDNNAVSATGAMGLLQFTQIAIDDVNENPGNLDFYFTDPFDPKQAVFAGLRLFELIVYRFDKLYFENFGGRPLASEYKMMIITAYNAGIGTMVDALNFANADASITFFELAYPSNDKGIEDTPIYKSILLNANANGVTNINGSINYDLVEERYNEITSYADMVLSLIP